MKFKIVLYLFFFVCIILFFQLINTNKILNHQDRLIQSQNSLQIRLKDSLAELNQYLSVQKYFTWETDEAAFPFKESIENELMQYNSPKELNTLIKDLPKGERFLIDRVQFVNAEWILIGFKGIEHWGQAFLTYEKTTKGVQFNAIKTIVMPL